MAGRKVNVAVVVGLDESEARAVSARMPGSETVAEKLGSAGASLLKEYARGGVMLGAEWVERIQSALGTAEPQAIAEAVERSVNRDGDAVLIPWRVDPTQVQFYRDLATQNSLTLEAQLKAVLDYANAQGWFSQAAPVTHYLLLTPGQGRFLQDLFHKDCVTGEDVIARLGEGREAAGVGEEEDPIFESLTGAE